MASYFHQELMIAFWSRVRFHNFSVHGIRSDYGEEVSFFPPWLASLVHFLTRLMNGYIRAIFCLSLFCRRCSVSALIFQLLSRYTFLSYPTKDFMVALGKAFQSFFLVAGAEVALPAFYHFMRKKPRGRRPL